ncbi:MAG: DUF2442 domain-containing protein [Bifidobacterium bifidum]
MTIDYSIKVTQCEPMPGYKLKVTCSDGATGIFEMSRYVERGMFKPLKDTQTFDRVRLTFGVPSWPGDIDIAASSMRVQCKSPNTLLGVIPLGSSTQTIPLRNIASVDTNIFLIAGLACMKDSALVGILFLVLAAANLANTMSAQLDFVNQAGGRNTVKVSILKKAKLMQLAQAIQQLVFADVEGQRHQESMDMTQKQYAAQTNSVLIQQQMLDQQRKANAGDNPPTPTE